LSTPLVTSVSSSALYGYVRCLYYPRLEELVKHDIECAVALSVDLELASLELGWLGRSRLDSGIGYK
jgi:hypothetical protein